MLKKNLKKVIMLLTLFTVSVMFTACGGGGAGGNGESLSEISYTGDDLGCTYTNGSAALKLWAPDAKSVKVILYNKSNQDTVVTTPLDLTMVKDETNGVWSIALDNSNTGITDLSGYFYQYLVDGRNALDPYAKSMAEFKVDTKGTGTDTVGKAVIVNPANTEVAGLDFATLPSNWKREDAVIWEIHVRDFTSQSGLSLTNQFGTYSAFKEKLQYLKELGVTHIQLMPVMSYYYGDESKAGTRENTWSAGGNNYNWGYDPHSYFALEGMYATDRTNGEARIKEFKELVKAIHDEGMAVTLDVVYNHTANETIFNNIYPGYYYRAGKNSSGCGNDTASERAMMSKMIVDSVKYWTKEYKVDGFRFDLMGILEAGAVQKAYNEVKAINPKTLFIGEGWKMYSGPSGTIGADQNWMTSTDDVAVFSDDIRNLVKSGYPSDGSKKFISGEAQDVVSLFKNLKAQPTNFTADDPGDVVQYIEAHDNLTLHDVIAVATGKSVATDNAEIHKRIRLGNTMLLTSQGIAFLHGGQEYGRTKQFKGTPDTSVQYSSDSIITSSAGDKFSHNSYDSSDLVNTFDWASLADTNSIEYKTKEYTKGLIALRKSTDAFRLGIKGTVDTHVELLYPTSGTEMIIAYSCKATNGDTYYVLINAAAVNKDFPITGLDTGTVLVDNDEAGITGVGTISGIVTRTSTKVTLEPLTAVIIKKPMDY